MNKIITNFLVGSDPEWFIVNFQKQRFISAEGVIGGSKKNPRPVGGGFFVQEDNVATEGNIPPAATKEELVSSILAIKETISKMIPKGCELYNGSMGNFTEKELDTDQGGTFGCEQDYNAYTGKINAPVCAIKGDLVRFAGGHLLTGYKNPKDKTSYELIKAQDLFLGVPSIILDSDRNRRGMYGKAGSCRIKDFGVEYRTLSNFWTKSKESIEWAYEGIAKSIDFVNNKEKISNSMSKKIVEIINTYDEKKALEVVREFSLL